MIKIDSREQANLHILKYFTEHNIQFFDDTMDFGDYENILSDKKIVVERKKSLIEFANNVGKGHARFKAELERAKELGYKVVILIEEIFDYIDLLFWNNPKSKLKHRVLKDGTKKEIRPITGTQIYRVCENWKTKYDIEFKFCSQGQSPKEILKILGVIYE